MNIQEAIYMACIDSFKSFRILPIDVEETLCREYQITKRELLIETCSLGIVPERYSRNYSTYSIQEQKKLLHSSVAVVGMGGLGGTILELLARIGIGRIVCADGDRFEASNLNRQAFSSESVLHHEKSSVGYQVLSDISSVSEYLCINCFLDKEGMERYLPGNDVVVDALGGLRDKPLLVEVCQSLRLPVICSSIAGLCGYVSLVRPGEQAPTDWLGNGVGVEEELGNLPQTVLFASSCVVQMLVDFLLGKKNSCRSILFDVERFLIQPVEM